MEKQPTIEQLEAALACEKQKRETYEYLSTSKCKEVEKLKTTLEAITNILNLVK